MSNIVLVSVFDHAVGEFAPCMCVNSDAAAIRIFINEVNRYDPNNLLQPTKVIFRYMWLVNLILRPVVWSIVILAFLSTVVIF